MPYNVISLHPDESVKGHCYVILIVQKSRHSIVLVAKAMKDSLLLTMLFKYGMTVLLLKRTIIRKMIHI